MARSLNLVQLVDPIDHSSTHSNSTLVSVNKKQETKERPSGGKLPKSNKKGVHFNKTVKARRISSHRTYTEEEKARTWYSSEESKAIRADAVVTVKRLMKGINVDKEENDCSRGLEFKTPKKNKVRQDRKENIVWSVLLEQESQVGVEGRKKINFEKLADVYMMVNKPCVAEAAKRGSQDMVAAWGYLT